jgi:hypothetical protein
MLFGEGALGLVLVGLWIFCIIDVITTPEGECRNLPKLVWLFIVLFLFDIGSIVWLIAGRNWDRRPGNLPYKGNYGRPAAPPRRYAGNPDDDEEFQAQLRARVEQQRRRARETRPDASRESQPGDEPTA